MFDFKKISTLYLACHICVALFSSPKLYACSRIFWFNEKQHAIVGRTLDLFPGLEFHEELWYIPAGTKINYGLDVDGSTVRGCCKVESKYPSLSMICRNDAADCAEGLFVVEAVNSKGLSAAILEMNASAYFPKKDMGKYKNKNFVLVNMIAQYIVSNFENVASALQAINNEKIIVLEALLTQGIPLPQQLSLVDKYGESAIINWISPKGSKLIISEPEKSRVVTNEPKIDIHLKNIDSGKYNYKKGDNKPPKLPGTCSSVDRFIRAWFYLNNVELSEPVVTDFIKQPLNPYFVTMESLMNCVKEPFMNDLEEDPDPFYWWPTLWTSIIDLSYGYYYIYPYGGYGWCWLNYDYLFSCIKWKHPKSIILRSKKIDGKKGDIIKPGNIINMFNAHKTCPLIIQQGHSN